MHAKYILRFDDIAPSMAWSKFSAFDELARKLNIPLLVGVVPNCLDPKLEVEPPSDKFWDVVRGWYGRGWTIAQHGYTHQYATRDSGMLGIGNKSEFAGLPYKEQFAKLKAGKDILVKQSVWAPVFMAPSHTFDHNTLLALADLEFQNLTDGYGLYPYGLGTLVAVPQLFSSTLHFGFGIYTVCLHVNSMTPAQSSKILTFIQAHRKQFISFDEAIGMRCSAPGIATASRFITSAVLRTVRSLRR